MLFDLGSGRKKTAIRIVYGFLALLFAVGFIGFGIGTDFGGGGLADIFSGGGSGEVDSQLSDDADDVQEQLDADPRNENLLLDLVRARYSAGNSLVQIDEETGQQQITEQAKEQYEGAVDAWDRYLKLNPAEPNASVASFAVSSFTVLAQAAQSATEASANFKAAADAQQILADARPSVGTLSNLAYYNYAALNFKEGDAAAKRAEAAAANEKAAKRVSEQLKTIRVQAKAFETQQETVENAGATGSQGNEALENPLGDLSGDGTGSPGGLTPAPAP